MQTSRSPTQSKAVGVIAVAPFAIAASLGETQPVQTPMSPQRPQVPMPLLTGAPFIVSPKTQVAIGPVIALATIGESIFGDS